MSKICRPWRRFDVRQARYGNPKPPRKCRFSPLIDPMMVRSVLYPRHVRRNSDEETRAKRITFLGLFGLCDSSLHRRPPALRPGRSVGQRSDLYLSKSFRPDREHFLARQVRNQGGRHIYKIDHHQGVFGLVRPRNALVGVILVSFRWIGQKKAKSSHNQACHHGYPDQNEPLGDLAQPNHARIENRRRPSRCPWADGHA